MGGFKREGVFKKYIFKRRWKHDRLNIRGKKELFIFQNEKEEESSQLLRI